MALWISTFPDEFSSLFDHDPMKSYVNASQAVANTAVDVKETPEAFQFVADLPGLQRDQVKVQIEEGNTLSISGERRREEKASTDTYHRVERTTGKFMRRFRLPANADVKKVTAACQNGVLTVQVPKIPPQKPEKPKTIDIAVA
eukprot:TRINITY_DN27482_c0_g1_i1.p2 TRINITY_DN27482_c0_g1~~TRINITY_DN27482_c0_g1_i1.p2  ORF type:complete len:144 (+),score=34.93 TRINITY_DN27482_c0_g1_i1:311-742(+)